MDIVKNCINFELTYCEQGVLRDFYKMMNEENLFIDWDTEDIWHFLEFISERLEEKTIPEEVFVCDGTTIRIVDKKNDRTRA